MAGGAGILVILDVMPEQVMAKHRKSGRRRSSRFFAYPIAANLALGTLADGVIISTALTAFGQTRVSLISADISWSIDGLTANEGPIEIGLGSSNLSNTETGEALDASPTSQTDIIAMERSRRPVRRVGQFPGQSANESLKDGDQIRTTLKFPVNEGVELNLWARNRSGATLTTGAIVRVSGTLFMRWT